MATVRMDQQDHKKIASSQSFHRRHRAARGGRAGAAGVALAFGLQCLRLPRAQAEDRADFRYETYDEGGGRIGVQTESALFELGATPWLSLKGQFVYDAISGATPTGAPPPSQINFATPPTGPLSDRAPIVPMHDYRSAGSFDSAFSFGQHHLTPEFSYSEEHDYVSYGGALNYSLDLNQKNTTLNAGWSHDWDRILPYAGTYIQQAQGKDSDQLLVGINQLLDPKTTLTVNFSFGDAVGYLNDPYRGVLFEDYPQYDPNNISLESEKRPRYRESYSLYLSLTRFVTTLDGSAELTYRPYTDTYGITAHTVELEWRQKIGRHLTITPSFRYYTQTAADFYGTQFPGDPSNPFDATPAPTYYSSDYRLSEMETFTYGLTITAKATDWLWFDLGYKRYNMYGLDHATSSSVYPKANIVSLSVRVWF